MSGGYEVDTSSLDQHQKDIQTIMEQVSGAIGPAREEFDPQAFGIIGEVWAAGLNAWVQSHTACVDAAVKAGQDVADSVGKMSQNYTDNETRTAKSFTSISDDMKGA